MVGVLSELMEKTEFQIVRYYAGIGTYSSYTDRFIRGMPSPDVLQGVAGAVPPSRTVFSRGGMSGTGILLGPKCFL